MALLSVDAIVRTGACASEFAPLSLRSFPLATAPSLSCALRIEVGLHAAVLCSQPDGDWAHAAAADRQEEQR